MAWIFVRILAEEVAETINMTNQDSMIPPAPMNVREERSYLPVILSGVATTALALLGVYILNVSSDVHIMGWHVDYIIPGGAIIVGIVASSGYGLASWLSGVKITKALLWIVLGLQVVAYFGAQYIEFKNLHLIHRADHSPVGFLEYYDATARSFAWKQDDGKVGEALGAWGYLFCGLEVIGFVAGGLIVPALLRKAPYCAECQRYMKTRQLAYIPASVPARKVKKSDVAAQSAYGEEQQKAFENGKKTVDAMQQLAAANSTSEFQRKIEELKPGKKQAMRLPGRLALQLVHCKSCFSGSLVVQLVTGQGKHIKHVEVGRSNQNPEFVRSIVQ